MKQLSRRINKIENTMKSMMMGRKKTIPQMIEEMTDKELKAIVDGILNDTDTPVPFFVKTKDGYMDVFEIKDEDRLERISNDYAHRHIELYTKDQLDTIGVKGMEVYNG